MQLLALVQLSRRQFQLQFQFQFQHLTGWPSLTGHSTIRQSTTRLARRRGGKRSRAYLVIGLIVLSCGLLSGNAMLVLLGILLLILHLDQRTAGVDVAMCTVLLSSWLIPQRELMLLVRDGRRMVAGARRGGSARGGRRGRECRVAGAAGGERGGG